MNHLKRGYKYNNESFVKYNFIQKPGKNGKEVLMLFQAKLFKGVLPEPGEGTQLPSRSKAGLHIRAFLSPPPGRVLPWTPPSPGPSEHPGIGMLAIQILSRRADKNHGQAAFSPGCAAENSLGQARCCFWQTLPSLGAPTAFHAQGGSSSAAARALLASVPALGPSCSGGRRGLHKALSCGVSRRHSAGPRSPGCCSG